MTTLPSSDRMHPCSDAWYMYIRVFYYRYAVYICIVLFLARIKYSYSILVLMIRMANSYIFKRTYKYMYCSHPSLQGAEVYNIMRLLSLTRIK